MRIEEPAMKHFQTVATQTSDSMMIPRARCMIRRVVIEIGDPLGEPSTSLLVDEVMVREEDHDGEKLSTSTSDS